MKIQNIPKIHDSLYQISSICLFLHYKEICMHNIIKPSFNPVSERFTLLMWALEGSDIVIKIIEVLLHDKYVF